VSRTPLLLALAVAAGASSLGCTITTIDSPVTVTTKQLPEASKPDVVAAAKEVTGSSCDRVVLMIIPVGFATVESAYAEALAQAPGADMLLNYETRSSLVFIAPFYYQVCSEVHGFAVSSQQVALAGERGGRAPVNVASTAGAGRARPR
jgi:hypothetical protein